MKPLTQAQLDTTICDNPGCDHLRHAAELYLHPACHSAAGLDVCYDKNTGCLRLECHACQKPVAIIAVSEG